MSLTKEEIKVARQQLQEQIKDLPPQQKQAAQSQIDSMTDQAIESMVEQQKSQQQKIFRMIISGEIPSIKIAENDKAIAVLSVKSISIGHTIIIPKNPVENPIEIPKEVHSLSEEISKKLITALEAKKTEVLPEKSFGEIILNIIPIYDSPLNLQSPRIDIPPEDLEKLKIKINVLKIEKKPKEIIKIEMKKPKKPLKLKRKIP